MDMRRIITALFHSRVTANHAAERLRRLNVPPERIALHSATDEDTTLASGTAPGSEHWLLRLLDAMFLPRADFEAHVEAMRRGGIVLTVEVEEDKAEAVRRELKEAGAEDLDAHEQDWLRHGWHPPPHRPTARGTAGPAVRREPVPGPARSYRIEASPVEDSSAPGEAGGPRRGG
jgi:hypothetical protein